jgi:hypothetical protein
LEIEALLTLMFMDVIVGNLMIPFVHGLDISFIFMIQMLTLSPPAVKTQ